MEPGTVRRKDRQISPEESREILERGAYGVLGTVDSDGQPYAVPLSYVVIDNEICFHCAHEGHKIENLAANPRVSFVVVGRAEAVYNGHFTTYYESAMVFGRVREITADDQKYAAIYALTEKYTPDHMDQAPDYIRKLMKPMAIYAVSIETLTGKANREK